MKTSRDICLAAGFRLLGYCAILGLAAGVFLLDVRSAGEGRVLFTEQSYVENAQLALLLLAAAAFAAGGWLNRARHIPACLLAGMAALAAVRELDWVFDGVTHGFWKAPAAAVVAVSVACVWKRRKELFDVFAKEVATVYWGTLCSGFSFVFIFSRIYGMKRNWEAVAGEHLSKAGVTSVRRLAEEGAELAGYALIFLAAMGFLSSCLRQRRERQAVGAE